MALHMMPRATNLLSPAGSQDLINREVVSLQSGTYTLSNQGNVDEAVVLGMREQEDKKVAKGSSHTFILSSAKTVAVEKDEASVFGVSWTKVSSPTLTRTDASVGLVANVGVNSGVVQNDFDYAQIFRELRLITGDLGNVFIRIPKFYIKKTDGVNFKTWQVSKTQYAGYYLPWCFWNFTTGQELPYFDYGKYKATKDGSNKLESKPNLCPLVLDHIVNFRTFARNNNTGGLLGYQQLDIHAYDVLRTLMLIEFATLNIQSVMQGYTAGQYSATHTATVAENNVNRIIIANAQADLYRVGQAISVGTALSGTQIFYGRNITAIDVYDASNKAISFDGATVNIAIGNIVYNTGWKNGFSAGIAASSGSIVSNSSGLYPCMYRGIESPFGDIWQFIDGVNINERQAWVAKNAADYASNVFAAPYEQLGYVNHNADGYVTAMGFDPNYPFAEFPTAVGGSNYYADYYYQTTGQRIALVGGYWSDGAGAGPSYWFLGTSSSYADVRFGARLLKKAL